MSTLVTSAAAAAGAAIPFVWPDAVARRRAGPRCPGRTMLPPPAIVNRHSRAVRTSKPRTTSATIALATVAAREVAPGLSNVIRRPGRRASFPPRQAPSAWRSRPLARPDPGCGPEVHGPHGSDGFLHVPVPEREGTSISISFLSLPPLPPFFYRESGYICTTGTVCQSSKG